MSGRVTGRRAFVARAGAIVGAETAEDVLRSLKAPKTPRKRQRPAHWPPGVDSELELALYVRLERAGLPLGEGQYRFVAGRQYRFDRAYPSHKVAIECQGGLYINGAHSRGSGVERDCLKQSLAAALGWRVLPISRAMIEDGSAVDLIRRALEIRVGPAGEEL